MSKKVLSILILFTFIVCLFSACNNEKKVDNGTLLEFPGLKWGMTPDEVIAALDINDSQILRNEMLPSENENSETAYDAWNMFATDLVFLGNDVSGAHFQFIRYPGRDFGLLYINLYFDENTDMNVLKERLVQFYGEGTVEPSPLYSFEEGELITSPNDSKNKQRFEEGFPYYFFSTQKGTDYLSADAQELYLEEYLKNPEISREAALEYLAKQPLVKITVLAMKNAQIASGKPYNISVVYQANQLVHNIQQFEK